MTLAIWKKEVHLVTQQAGTYLSAATPVNQPAFIYVPTLFVINIPDGSSQSEIESKLGGLNEGESCGFDNWPADVQYIYDHDFERTAKLSRSWMDL